MKNSIKYKTVEEYLTSVPDNAKLYLNTIRSIIKETEPNAEELISYNMPAFKYYGILVYFAAYKNHIGFYPASINTNIVFKDELVNYKTSKGTIQFPINQDIPIDLITKIVEYRINENYERNKEKKP